ncbi:cytochrome P450 71A6-like [Salvia divinorum]|uniref:Cytochrome P450 71A6-like n=1 Tax=Salvia divinorum TaxID=28513 RepID=A0ABD1IHW2_SALDI
MTNDVISLVALGKKSGGGERNFHKIIAEFEELLGVVPVWEYIPWLSWMRRFDGVDGRIERVGRALDEFLETVIQEHRVRERRESDDGELDFVDILLDFQRENGSGYFVDDNTIKAIILDMYAGGTDTTSTTLEWAMTELIRNPTIMKTLQNEVREVAGSKVEIDEKDLEKMLYLKAVIKESLRDPLLWEKPEQFYPERFLETSIDYKGLHFELTPFGAGRRGCPGITFATAVFELALAKLVHKFDFELPNGVKMEELDVSESSGLTIHKKYPLLVVVTPRTS